MKKYKQQFKQESTISFDNQLKDIANLEDLPKETQKWLYREVDSFTSKGFQAFIGLIGRTIAIDMGGYWTKDYDKGGKFVVNSYGINSKFSKGYIMPLEWTAY